MNYYEKIFNLIPDFIFIHDNTGLIKIMNQSAAEYFKDVTTLDRIVTDDKILGKIYTFEEHSPVKGVEINLTLPGGNEMEFEINSYVFKDDASKPLKMTILKNITHVKEVERQFCLAQKQEVVGAMAAGFAHDFKNILNNIKLYLKLIKQSEQMEQVEKYCGVIDELINDSNGFIRQVLSIARDRSNNLEEVVLGDVIEETLQVLERILPKNVGIVFTDMAKNAVIKIVKTRFINAIFNLCLNSVDAIGNNAGTIRITTERTSISGNHYVKITVTDNGSGIPHNIIDKIFNTFYTTKKYGTGLGLPMVKLAIKDFGGSIEVESEEGFFTTFKIFLPEVIYGEHR